MHVASGIGTSCTPSEAAAFFITLAHVLPCGACRTHYGANKDALVQGTVGAGARRRVYQAIADMRGKIKAADAVTVDEQRAFEQETKPIAHNSAWMLAFACAFEWDQLGRGPLAPLINFLRAMVDVWPDTDSGAKAEMRSGLDEAVPEGMTAVQWVHRWANLVATPRSAPPQMDVLVETFGQACDSCTRLVQTGDPAPPTQPSHHPSVIIPSILLLVTLSLVIALCALRLRGG